MILTLIVKENEMNDEIINLILEKAKENKVCYMTIEGVAIQNLDSFIKQPIDGILYDLNRDKSVILTHLRNENYMKWINDYAVAMTIEYLKNKVETLEKEISEMDETIKGLLIQKVDNE